MPDNGPSLFDPLADSLHRRELAIFCGAGISMDRPTGLPSWRELTDAMLTAIGDASNEPAGKDFARHVAAAKLPPEMIAQKLHDIFGDEFFNSLDVLRTGEPNLTHLYLASLAKTGFLPVIITANFDTFIEKALRALEVPYQVYRRDSEFEDFLQNPPKGKVVLIKIHGCIEAKDTIIATLKDTGRGLGTGKKRVLNELLKRYFFLFLGYSGNDFNLDDNKLAMRDAQTTARGFYWNFRPGESNPAVEGLIRDYAGRGHKLNHVLPDLLVELQARVHGSPMAAGMKRWASKLPPEHFRVLGELLHHAGHLEEAKACYELQGKTRNSPQTRTIDPKRRAASLHNLGRLAADKGEFNEALDCYNRALQLEEKFEDKRAMAETLHQIGHLQQSRGDLSTALSYYQQALDLQRGDNSIASAILHQIGTVHQERGDLDGAREWYSQALKIEEKQGDHEAMAATLHQLGLVHHAREELDEALKTLNRAKMYEEKLGIKRGLAPTLSAIGLIQLQQQDFDKAKENFKKAKEIEEDLQNKAGQAACCHNLGIVAFETGEFDLAKWNFDAALKLREALNDHTGTAETLDWVGELLKATGDLAGAKRSFIRAAELFRQAGVPDRADAMREQAENV